MITRRVAVLVVALLAAGHTLVAQSGTARIAGVVVDAQTPPLAVHRAILTLTGAELPAGLAAVSDDQGRFSFDRLPAGRFTLSASKPAYLKMAYGALRPGGTGTPITITAGQQITDVRMTLPHGSAIGGTVRDVKGDPIPRLQVSVIPLNVSVARPPSRTDAATTDDRGTYRLFGLTPGPYLVAASMGLSGGIGEVGVMSTAEVDAAFARLRQGPRGTGQANPKESSPSSIVRPTRPFNPTPIFFPGVPAPSAATQITLGVGEERNDVDFVYQLARSAVVSGTIAGIPIGTAGGISVQLTADGPATFPFGFGTGPMLNRGGVGADGAFTFTSVTPGTYTLTARTGGALPAARGGGTQTSAPLLFATTSLDISGEDVVGIALTLQPAPRVDGKLVFVPTTLTPPADFTRIGVRLTASSGAAARLAQLVEVGLAAPAQAAVSAAAIRADGTFDLSGVLPGSYQISTTGLPVGWRLKSALLGDRDLSDLPFEIGTADVNGVVVTLTDTHSQISGRVLQNSGAPISTYFVVAFPADRALWLPQSRRMKSARPATDGQFRLDDLPAGEYYLAALTDADQDEWQTPAILTQAMAGGVKFTLGDGEKKTQDLVLRSAR